MVGVYFGKPIQVRALRGRKKKDSEDEKNENWRSPYYYYRCILTRYFSISSNRKRQSRYGGAFDRGYLYVLNNKQNVGVKKIKEKRSQKKIIKPRDNIAASFMCGKGLPKIVRGGRRGGGPLCDTRPRDFRVVCII